MITRSPKRAMEYGAGILAAIVVAGGVYLYLRPTQNSRMDVRTHHAMVPAAFSRTAPARVEQVTGNARQALGRGVPRGMVYVPAGWFWMGCGLKNGCGGDEKPYHRVYLDAYFIDKNDVTVDEYGQCVSTGGCMEPPRVEGCNYGVKGRGDHPINCVFWDQANTYCRWAGKRLPTEAQWEKAARGTDGRIYPWGNKFSPHNSCNSLSPYSQRHHTCAVGSHPKDKSPYGVMDMAGNVYNWCSDWYDANYYADSPDHDPIRPDKGTYHVLRGGSWLNCNPTYLRWSSRSNNAVPTYWFDDNGFRCVRRATR
ncbi:MAG: formylglycine-generating enzyme family protein [Deltaproteobacteria bacterium]|nr:formylglycine-generating enzyme family protein [Deltaproteobacteria bacterium]